MRVLGVSAEYHDSSAALVEDGRIVAAAAEERFTRIRHDASLPRFAIEFCLDQAGIDARDLDAIVFYEDPAKKFSRVLASTLAEFPRSTREFVTAMRGWLGRRLWVGDRLASLTGVHPNRINFASHHGCHATQAFLTSGYDDAAILTVDAVGEWSSTTLGHGNRERGIITMEEIPYPHSIGLVYAAFTAFLGFRPNDGECSTMALAAFGKPRFADKVRRLLRPQSSGLYDIDPTAFRFFATNASLFTNYFVELFGSPRDPRTSLPFRADGKSADITSEAQRYADIAASIQLLLEEVLLGLAGRAHRITGSTRLCLSGGVAMNAVAIGRLLAESPFAEIFIPPDPGDGGAAIGAALSGGDREAAIVNARPREVYYGRSYDVDSAVSLLPHINVSRHQHQLAEHCQGYSQLIFKTVGDEGHLVDEISSDVVGGRIVGWFQDRFEMGPRALGNRSILVDPGNPAAVQRLSKGVKRRAAFRPYALSLAAHEASRVFDWESIPLAATRMQMTGPVSQSSASRVPAGLHVDLTTRPQVCSLGDNPRFHKLLIAIGQRSGLAAVINTSFNDPGNPIVASPLDALLVFLRTDIDVLVLGNNVVRKIK